MAKSLRQFVICEPGTPETMNWTTFFQYMPIPKCVLPSFKALYAGSQAIIVSTDSEEVVLPFLHPESISFSSIWVLALWKKEQQTLSVHFLHPICNLLNFYHVFSELIFSIFSLERELLHLSYHGYRLIFFARLPGLGGGGQISFLFFKEWINYDWQIKFILMFCI